MVSDFDLRLIFSEGFDTGFIFCERFGNQKMLYVLFTFIKLFNIGGLSYRMSMCDILQQMDFLWS